MSHLESAIEKDVADYAKRRGWLGVKLMRCNVNGWPDRMFIRKGRVIFIEFKQLGEEPKEQQAKRHREIRAQSIEVFVVDDREVGYAILR